MNGEGRMDEITEEEEAFFGEVPEEWCREENYVDVVADIPEFQPHIDPNTEYKDFPEEKIWSSEAFEKNMGNRFSAYHIIARSVLTVNQEIGGIPNMEALENSCMDNADQYLSNALHDSEYEPQVALRRIFSEKIPAHITQRWSSKDIDLFTKGVKQYWKKFSMIRKKLLPQKSPMELISFYYEWKKSPTALEIQASRPRRFPKTKSPPTTQKPASQSLELPAVATSGRMVTRSVTAAMLKKNKSDVGAIVPPKKKNVGAKRKRKSVVS